MRVNLTNILETPKLIKLSFQRKGCHILNSDLNTDLNYKHSLNLLNTRESVRQKNPLCDATVLLSNMRKIQIPLQSVFAIPLSPLSLPFSTESLMRCENTQIFFFSGEGISLLCLASQNSEDFHVSETPDPF